MLHPCSATPDIHWPIFHVFGNGTFHTASGIGGAHDVNALFTFRHRWHLMNQANAPDGGTGWSHFVSDDLVHWQPLTTQLGPAGWDGSLSIVEGTPTILFDCQSAAHCVGSSTHTSDLPVIGVGRPANITDPLLLDWIKDANNPIQVLNRRPRYAGPSNLWRGGPQKRWRMVMITGSATGLYESKDDSLHEWTLLNATFYPARGGGGGLFHRLPIHTEVNSSSFSSYSTDTTFTVTNASDAPTSRFTHYLQTNDPSKGGHADGRQWFVLGTHDEISTRFEPTSRRLVPLDFSASHVYSTIGYRDREHPLHVGWIYSLNDFLASAK